MHVSILNNAKMVLLSVATNQNVVIALDHCSILLDKPLNNALSTCETSGGR